MIEVRLHGRGGQGAVVAAIIMAKAAMLEGKYSQAFPLFGAERRGAAVQAFLRIDSKVIHARDIVESPDHVIVLDQALIQSGVVQVDKNLKPGGLILINSPQDPGAFSFPDEYSVVTVNAAAIAMKHGLGSAQAPIVNTPMVGAFVGLTDLVSLEHMSQAIDKEVPMRQQDNIAAALEAYQDIQTKKAV